MGFLDGLTTTQKVVGAGALGVAGLYALSRRGGGGVGGEVPLAAVVDVRRPTDDINIPGSEYATDGQGFQTIARINQQFVSLLGSMLPGGGNSVTGPGTVIPPTPTTPAVPNTPSLPSNPAPGQANARMDALERANARNRYNLQRTQIRDIQQGGITQAEWERYQQLVGNRERMSEKYGFVNEYKALEQPNAKR